jgi:hypothetical protein
MTANVQASSRPAAVTTADEGREASYRVELVENPSELPLERADVINAEVAELACRACGGDAENEEQAQAIRAGWQAYCMNPGGRSQDYDRLGLVWAEDRLAGFTGWCVEQLEPDITVLWFKAAGIDPTDHGRGAFAAARDITADLRWMTSFGAPTYFVMRTPNPLIYDTCKRWWNRYPDFWRRYFPKIGEDGRMEPIGDQDRETAIRIATGLWPDCEFDPDCFAVRDFLGEYGRDIWNVETPHTADPGTTKFFKDNLRGDNQDALMTAVLFYE